MSHSVYVMLNADSWPLYVGMTGRGRRRIHEHAGDKIWWPEVASVRVFHVDTREEALDLETYLVHVLDPPCNGPVSGNWTRGRDIADRLELAFREPEEPVRSAASAA